MPVAQKNRHMTAFTRHAGTWQCKRQPFGSCKAPFAFQRAVDMILARIKWEVCLGYVDDIIVISKTAESHPGHLEDEAWLPEAHGISLKASKCHFFQEEVECLGHVTRLG